MTRKQKEEIVEKIKKDLSKYSCIALADLTNLPSKQFNLIKKKVGDKIVFVVSKKTLFSRALDSREDTKQLIPLIKGSPALLLTNLEAFKLYKLIKENKSMAFAKPGSIASSDILVPAGETSLTPGPVLTELKQLGIEAKIQGNRVNILKDAVIVKKGEIISQNAAGILSKLGIETAEIKLNVVAVLDKGKLYSSSDLDVDESAYLNAIKSAYTHAINLAVFAGIYTKESVEVMIRKAVGEASALERLVSSKSPAQNQ